jgi:amino acid transporter
VIQASFSYIGTEIVAIAAGETKDPRKTLPRAIKVSTSPAALRPSSPTLSASLLTLSYLQNVYIRILFFYLLVSRPPIRNRPSERQ